MPIAPIRRRAAAAAALVAAIGLALPMPGRTQGKAALNLAMIGEPPTLDVQSTPADLVCIIMQHVYETLYTFDAKSNLMPMLAEGMPKVSADGKVIQHRAAQGRQAAQRPRAGCRGCGGQPQALDGGVAAWQVGQCAGGEPGRQGAAQRWRSC